MGAITQLLGGVTQVWPNVTFIICIFVILLFKPERIAKSSLFWLGCVLFALSLIAPTLSTFLPEPETTNSARRTIQLVEPSSLTMKLSQFASIGLYALAFLATVSSLMPHGASQSTAPSEELR